MMRTPIFVSEQQLNPADRQHAVLCSQTQRLRILYSKILASLQTMPQDAAYRRYTEQLVGERYDLVKTVRHASTNVHKHTQHAHAHEDGTPAP